MRELEDFVAWVRIRRPIAKDASIDEKTLEYVTKGIEAFLADQSPWPKKRGAKSNKDKMWECYYLTQFAEGDDPHLPRHKSATKDGKSDGGYVLIGKRLRISASTVETHVATARRLFSTQEGRIDFLKWFAKYKGANAVTYTPANHHDSIDERGRRRGG